MRLYMTVQILNPTDGKSSSTGLLKQRLKRRKHTTTTPRVDNTLVLSLLQFTSTLYGTRNIEQMIAQECDENIYSSVKVTVQFLKVFHIYILYLS